MKRVLLIKLTSIGDLIHALPALSDAYEAIPGIVFDWVIDENFQEIATWHPAISKIYTTNHRKWKQNLFSSKTYSSIYQLIRNFRKPKYDLIIDGQGNFKSCLLTLCSKGTTAGYDRHSAREKIVFLAYQKTYSVSLQDHAIDRLRQLFALSLGYPLPTTPPQFNLLQEHFTPPPCPLPDHYFVFVHSASWNTKLWPEEHWIELIQKTTSLGFPILLPWGNPTEEARAKRLATHPLVHVLPKLTLSQAGYILSRAKGCVSMDTGLSHISAALNIPTITLYGATDSGLNGASGQCHLQSHLPCAPCKRKTCRIAPHAPTPPCLAQITPTQVFNQLKAILK